MKSIDTGSGSRRLRHFLGTAQALARSHSDRRAFWLRLSKPENLFQPYGDTFVDRYPQVFAFVRAQIGASSRVRLLSFGCSKGDEVVSLRHYFPAAVIRGLDISRGNIRDCQKRSELAGDAGVDFVRAGTARGEKREHYDAIFCMAVFRHGKLATAKERSCTPFITFQAFDSTVSELAACLKPGGLLVIEHCNFRFSDTSSAKSFECIRRRPRVDLERERTPLFGPDNLLLDDQDEVGTVFRKMSTDGTAPRSQRG